MMKRKQWVSATSGLTVAMALALSGCGGSSSDSPAGNGNNGGNGTSSGLTITAVDPYITGAEFCIDLNDNNACDAGEPTAKDLGNGQYQFTNYTPDAVYKILAKNKGTESNPNYGTHNGAAYPLNIRSLTAANQVTGFVTPTSTMQLNQNITQVQLLQVLNQFSHMLGKTVTAGDISGDHIKDIINKKPSELTEADLAVIRAQLTVYGAMRIMQGSDKIRSLTGDQFMVSAMNGGANNTVFTIFNTLVTNVAHAIDKNALSSFDGQLPDILKNAYPIRMDVVVATGVAIVDFMTQKGYDACNQSDGDVAQIQGALSPYLSKIQGVAQDMGPKYYQAKNKEMSGPYKDGVVSQIGSAGFDCASGHFKVSEPTSGTLTVSCITE